jgi:hypothetical protein
VHRLSFYCLSAILISGSFIPTPAQAEVPAPGNWTLLYDWGCDGSYGSTKMIVRDNRSWAIDEGYNGAWIREAGMFMFTFAGSKTTYAGNIASKSITGINTTFQGLKGCFYMLQEGVPGSSIPKRGVGRAETRDAQGRIRK